jgi:hypothetical protein
LIAAMNSSMVKPVQVQAAAITTTSSERSAFDCHGTASPPNFSMT